MVNVNGNRTSKRLILSIVSLSNDDAVLTHLDLQLLNRISALDRSNLNRIICLRYANQSIGSCSIKLGNAKIAAVPADTLQNLTLRVIGGELQFLTHKNTGLVACRLDGHIIGLNHQGNTALVVSATHHSRDIDRHGTSLSASHNTGIVRRAGCKCNVTRRFLRVYLPGVRVAKQITSAIDHRGQRHAFTHKHSASRRVNSYFTGSGRIRRRNRELLNNALAIHRKANFRGTCLASGQHTGIADCQYTRFGFVLNFPVGDNECGFDLISVRTGITQLHRFANLHGAGRCFRSACLNDFQIFRRLNDGKGRGTSISAAFTRHLDGDLALRRALYCTGDIRSRLHLDTISRIKRPNQLSAGNRRSNGIRCAQRDLIHADNNVFARLRAGDLQFFRRQRRYRHHGQNHDDHQKHRQYPFLHMNCLLDILVAIAL